MQLETSSALKQLNHSVLLARAKGLGNLLSEQSSVGENQGRLTDETINALAGADLFSLFVPKCLGGAELSPTEGLEIIESISRADGSTGWVVMATQVSVASCAAFLKPPVAKAIFGTHIPLIAGQGAPMGRADTELGGYRLNGSWNYGSGLLHSEWIHTGAMVHQDGAPRSYPGTTQPDARIFIVPINQAELKGNWDVLGLRATGSIDYSIKNVFVSEDYTHRLNANRPHQGGDLYRLGILGLATVGHTGFALGIARRTLDEIARVAQASSGRPSMLSNRGGGENFHLQYGRSEAQLLAARAFAFDIWNQIQCRLLGGDDPTVRQITLARLAFTNATSVATTIGNLAFEFGGGSALRSGSIQRCFRDQRAGAQHLTASEAVVRECAKELLGLMQGKVWSLAQMIDLN